MPFEGESTAEYWRRTWTPEYYGEWFIRLTRSRLTTHVMVDLAAENEIPEGMSDEQWVAEERRKCFAEREADKQLAAKIAIEALAAAAADAARGSKMTRKAPTNAQINAHVERIVQERQAEIMGA